MAGYHYHKRLGMPRHTLAFMTCYSWFEGAYGPIFFSRHRRFPLIFVYFQPLRWNICFLLFVINLSRYKVELYISIYNVLAENLDHKSTGRLDIERPSMRFLRRSNIEPVVL